MKNLPSAAWIMGAAEQHICLSDNVGLRLLSVTGLQCQCVFTVGFCMYVGIRDVGALYLFSRSGGRADFMINISTQICE